MHTHKTAGTIEEQADGQTDARGGAYTGLAGKLRRARQVAPDGTDDDVAVAVGRRAWRTGADPADIFAALDDSAGSEAAAANHKCSHCDGRLEATDYERVFQCARCDRFTHEVVRS